MKQTIRPTGWLRLATLAACAMLAASAVCDDWNQSRQQFSKTIQHKVSLKYLLYLPDGYETDGAKKWPLLLFLHGAGERGDNLELVTKHGPPKLIKNGKKFPFIVVSPQCPKGRWWDEETLSALLDEVLAVQAVDASRVYCTGLSMGGFGTWSLAAHFPDRFAAIAPICGGGSRTVVWRLRRMPIWVFHGAKDRAVPLEESQRLVDALKRRGGNVKFTVYPEAGHDSWTESYNNPKLYEWFLSHSTSKD